MNLFCRISEAKLDLKSVELRDFICEPERLRASLFDFEFAPATVLDSAAATPFLFEVDATRSNTTSGRDTISKLCFRSRSGVEAGGKSIAYNRTVTRCRRSLSPGSAGLKNDSMLTLEFARLLQSSARFVAGPNYGAKIDRGFQARCLQSERQSGASTESWRVYGRCGRDRARQDDL